MRLIAAFVALSLAAGAHAQSVQDSLRPPPVMREFRGLWVATVANMDWPSRPGLSTADQQHELLAILDRAAEIGMNAIILQVRPEADALYASRYEPWSRFLTGRQGRAPDPLWDPLAFAVAEAHKRGLELHAWFNPYRAAYWKDSSRARTHVSRRRPGLVVPYGRYLWMDPGKPEVRERMIRVVLDVIRRYDVDGVHIDDYFYPYPETDSAGRKIDFPDAATYATYRRRGGSLSRADWRRRNVNTLVRELYAAVKGEKMWVKVGISPFGIWRPGVPSGTTAGVDQYDELYSDSRKWLRDGTLDYVAPQLYWPIEPAEQSYPALLRWWTDESVKRRHVWPGLALYKLPVSGPKHMSADDIVREMFLTRETPGASGHVLFNASVLMDNVDGIADRLAAMYAEPAIMPASPWLDRVAPRRPAVRAVADSATASLCLRLAPRRNEFIWQWVVQAHTRSGWRTVVLPGGVRTHILREQAQAQAQAQDAAPVDVLSVFAVDRNGNASPSVIVRPMASAAVAQGGESRNEVRVPIAKEPRCRAPD